MAELNVIGKWVSAPGGEDIVTGKARYCSDIRLPGMLTGKLLYSPYARARIKSLNVEKARGMPGVHAVITHADIPGENSYLYSDPDQPILARDEIRFQGDAVAAVAAIDEQAAQAALAAIEVEYEPLAGRYF